MPFHLFPSILSRLSCVYVTCYAKFSTYYANTKQLAIMEGPFCIDYRTRIKAMLWFVLIPDSSLRNANH